VKIEMNKIVLFILAGLLAAGPARAQVPEEAARPEAAPSVPHAEDTATWEKAYDFVRMFKLETLWYLHLRYGYDGDDYYDRFDIGRGYLTMKIKPVKWFESRITLDAHQDDSGDMKVRLKYLYGKFVVPVETKVVTEPSLEFGLVHTPWLDYEEHVNWYRCQGTMFMERNKLFNSADFGATFGMLLGSKLPSEYQEKVSNQYPGTWGSLALGVYNGGGYHAIEKNKGKSFEGRLSVRPLGRILPNLQLSYFVVVGRGNEEAGAGYDPPEWRTHAFMASFEHEYIVVTGQFVMGRGNQKGDYTDWLTETDPVTGEEVRTGIEDVHDLMGASGYLEVKLPWIWSSLVGRYDWFRKQDGGEDFDTMRIIAGYALHFHKFHKNLVMIDVDYVIPDRDVVDVSDLWEVKLTLQVSL
jgi:hypothetical protein